MELQNHSQSHSAVDPQFHHLPVTRSNIKQKTKTEITRITDLDNPMLRLYESKERQIVKEIANIAEQEQQLIELRRKHGFDVNALPNTNKFPSLSSLSPMKLKSNTNGAVDEKENLLQETEGTSNSKDSISSVHNDDTKESD